MKNKFLKILSKPQIVIPSFTLIGIIITIFFYGQVGKAPAIDIKGQENMNPVLESGTNINLSFPKSGRVKEVSVVESIQRTSFSKTTISRWRRSCESSKRST
jgi:multidrug efflux pump subunit AcrA (membrane-fusion protein)